MNSPHDHVWCGIPEKKRGPGSRNCIKQELSQAILNVARQRKEAQVLVSSGDCICRGKIALSTQLSIFLFKLHDLH